MNSILKKALFITLQIGFLYLINSIGLWLKEIFHLSIPGSILGLLLLFILLLFRIVPLKWIDGGASLVLAYLPLFFIPATVGIVNYMEIFRYKGLVSILVIIFTTVIISGFSGGISQLLIYLLRKEVK